jgi:hypothetical protein
LSKIFDAIKRAQTPRASTAATARDPGSAQAERRRSARWTAHVPVFVYGHTAGSQPFHEEAYSADVSAVGARLIMAATVRPGQTLLLTNKVTQAEQECRVAYVADHDAQSLKVAVQFQKPAPDFWRIVATSRRDGPPQTADEEKDSR